MTRRLFLKGLTGLFVAPAIVRAESLMKIVVPQSVISLDDCNASELSALIFAVRTRTTNTAVEELLRSHNQMLAFLKR